MKTTVYVDRRALFLEIREGRTARTRRRPEAADAVRDLVEVGHRVVVLGGRFRADRSGEPVPGDGRPHLEREAALPASAAGWLVTSDPGLCGQARDRRGLRTVLVGPSRPGTSLAFRPCDVEARDLRDAVLAILATEAMPAAADVQAAGR